MKVIDESKLENWIITIKFLLEDTKEVLENNRALWYRRKTGDVERYESLISDAENGIKEIQAAIDSPSLDDTEVKPEPALYQWRSFSLKGITLTDWQHCTKDQHDFPELYHHLDRKRVEVRALYAEPPRQIAVSEATLEPVAWVTPSRYGSQVTLYEPKKPMPWTDDEIEWYCRPLYAEPPRSEPLTDDEIIAIGYKAGFAIDCIKNDETEEIEEGFLDEFGDVDNSSYFKFARLIEKHHGIK